jgi:ATP-dependent Clp protease adaptor protein ClpS
MSEKKPFHGEPDGEVTVQEAQPKVKAPPKYAVILHNDDYTPMEFVVEILMKFFHKNQVEAEKIMLQVHHQGSGVAGIYPHDIAETKVALVNDYSRQMRHPLKCSMEAV